MKDLDHPNIIKAKEIFEDDSANIKLRVPNKLYLIMEYVGVWNRRMMISGTGHFPSSFTTDIFFLVEVLLLHTLSGDILLVLLHLTFTNCVLYSSVFCRVIRVKQVVIVCVNGL